MKCNKTYRLEVYPAGKDYYIVASTNESLTGCLAECYDILRSLGFTADYIQRVENLASGLFKEQQVNVKRTVEDGVITCKLIIRHHCRKTCPIHCGANPGTC